MDRQFGNLKAIFKSFYKKDLYRDVKNNWLGIGAGYILVVLLVTSLFQSFLVVNFIHPAERALSEAWENVPAITIEEGVAESNDNKKIQVKSDWGKQLIEINTSKSVPDLKGSGATVFITKTAIYTRNTDGDVTRSAYPDSRRIIDFDPGKLKPKLSHSFSYFPAIVLYPFMVFFGFIASFIGGVIFSAVLKVIALVLSATISCSQAMRLTFVAMTPGFVFSMLLTFFQVSLFHLIIFPLLLTAIYLVYAVWCNRSQ